MVELRDVEDGVVERARRGHAATAACGVCGKESLEDLDQALPSVVAVDCPLALLAGIFGFIMRRYGFSMVTIAIGFILGPLVEKSYAQSLMISGGSLKIFVAQPIALILMVLTFSVIALPIVSGLRKRRRNDK